MNFLLLAAEVAPADDPITGLIQYGALGIIVLVLIVYARGQIKRETERSDKAEKRVETLEDYIRSEFLPKQERSNYLHNQTADVLEKALIQLTEYKAAKEEAERKAKEAVDDARRRDEIRREMEGNKDGSQ